MCPQLLTRRHINGNIMKNIFRIAFPFLLLMKPIAASRRPEYVTKWHLTIRWCACCHAVAQ
jgi:hypothetical protein